MSKTILFDLTAAELERFVTDMGQPRFRAKQIAEWMGRGAPDFSVMKNIPETFSDEKNGIKRPFYGIVSFEPFTNFYSK